MKVISNTKNKGFTLIELLATLAILSIVITIVIYASVNLITNAKENSYQVTINNVEKEAGAYVLEDNSLIDWVNGITNDYEYQCVTVQNLIDKGFFKSDVLDSYVSEDIKIQTNNYIYIERDKNTKTITKNILLVNDRLELYSGLCSGIESYGNIDIDVEPEGWSREKVITITYKINNNTDKVSNYGYSYEVNENNYSSNFNKRIIEKKVTLTDNGTIYADIIDLNGNVIFSNSKIVEKIDREAPIIKINYSGSEVVRGSVIIPINITDKGSGLDIDSVSLSDLNVYIGDTKITTGLSLEEVDENNYNLKIENLLNAGEVKIIIEKDKILDKVENGNEKIELNPGVSFSNTYTISYNANGGTGSMSNITCTYGSSSCTISANGFSRTGYTFNGWTTNPNGTNDGYYWTNWSGNWEYTDGEYGINNGNLKLYARWKANTYTISYNANGGTGSMSNTTCTYRSSCAISANGFNRTGYTFNGWTTNPNGTSDGYYWTNWSGNWEYTDGEYGINNGNLKLYARWEANTYTISYNANGGTGSMSNTTCTYGSSCAISANGFSKTGYTFTGWNTNSTGTGTGYKPGSSYTENSAVTLYAIWKVNTYAVSYNANGGTNAPSAQTKTYGTNLTLSKTVPTRTGYTFEGWNTNSTGTGTGYKPGSSYTENSAVTLYAIWKTNSTQCYKIITTSGMNCRASRSTNAAISGSLYYGNYYYLTYSAKENGYDWYYYRDGNCYVAYKDTWFTKQGETCPIIVSIGGTCSCDYHHHDFGQDVVANFPCNYYGLYNKTDCNNFCWKQYAGTANSQTNCYSTSS